jgi:hypothetical protein
MTNKASFDIPTVRAARQATGYMADGIIQYIAGARAPLRNLLHRKTILLIYSIKETNGCRELPKGRVIARIKTFNRSGRLDREDFGVG